MSELKKFLDTIDSHGTDKFIYFEESEYSYCEIISKSYALARLLESYKYRKIFFNLKNSPLSICMYIAGWIANRNRNIIRH